MSNEHWTWSIDESLPSFLGAGDDFMQRMLAELEKQAWPEREIFGIRLATEEALVNAIRHGNGLNHEKSVRIACKISPQKFWVQISDQGSGFEPDALPDCTAAQNLQRPCGRGVMLMRNFMSRVQYNQQGNRVVMEKLRGVSSSA